MVISRPLGGGPEGRPNRVLFGSLLDMLRPVSMAGIGSPVIVTFDPGWEGKLHAFILEPGVDGADEDEFTLFYAVSHDQGESWSAAERLADGLQANPTTSNLTARVLPDGGIHVVWAGMRAPDFLNHVHRPPRSTAFTHSLVSTPLGPTVTWLLGEDEDGAAVLVFESWDAQAEEEEYVLRSRWEGGAWSAPAPFIFGQWAAGIFPIEGAGGGWGLGLIAVPLLADIPEGVTPAQEVRIQYPFVAGR